MSSGNDDRPLAKWTTSNILGLMGFIAMIVAAWVTLNERVSALENEAIHTSKQMDSIDRKLDMLLQRGK